MPFHSYIVQRNTENRAGGDCEKMYRINNSVLLHDGCLDCFWEHAMFLDMDGDCLILVLSTPDFTYALVGKFVTPLRTETKLPYFSSEECIIPQSEWRVMYCLSLVSPFLAMEFSSCFPPLHVMFPKALITIGRAEILCLLSLYLPLQ